MSHKFDQVRPHFSIFMTCYGWSQLRHHFWTSHHKQPEQTPCAKCWLITSVCAEGVWLVEDMFFFLFLLTQKGTLISWCPSFPHTCASQIGGTGWSGCCRVPPRDWSESRKKINPGPSNLSMVNKTISNKTISDSFNAGTVNQCTPCYLNTNDYYCL